MIENGHNTARYSPIKIDSIMLPSCLVFSSLYVNIAQKTHAITQYVAIAIMAIIAMIFSMFMLFKIYSIKNRMHCK